MQLTKDKNKPANEQADWGWNETTNEGYPDFSKTDFRIPFNPETFQPINPEFVLRGFSTGENLL